MQIAIILPSYNESLTIENVIKDFHSELPDSSIIVIDNNSNDNTKKLAEETLNKLNCRGGVWSVRRQGKANAIRWAFQHIEADYYVMVDADSTYPCEKIHELINEIKKEDIDMVVGDRLTQGDYQTATSRSFHTFGNNLVRWFINFLFRTKLSDIMSGYRVFSRRFIRTFPILCEGFELETELTLHALDKRLGIKEVPINLKRRPKGSVSKLNTFSDGFRVIKTIFHVFKHYRPLSFFGSLASFFCIIGLLCGTLPIYEYIEFQYISRVPLAILASSIMVFSLVLLAIGLILDTVSYSQKIQFEQNLQRETDSQTLE
jgi:glycosyltransferase involved in cell wall biosynthesis